MVNTLFGFGWIWLSFFFFLKKKEEAVNKKITIYIDYNGTAVLYVGDNNTQN